MTRSIRTHFTNLSLALALTVSAWGAEKPEVAEQNWAQAQQEYYQALKKLKTPRNPEEVKQLKEKILEPKKKELTDAYAKPKTAGSEKTAGKATDQESAKPEAPKTVLDGKDVKNEIRYSKKGAPADMTKEESPDYGGPEVISAPNDNGVGEIAYPKKNIKK